MDPLPCPQPQPKPGAPHRARLGRDAFNQVAFAKGAPLFWRSDANNDGKIDTDEVAPLLFASAPAPRDKAELEAAIAATMATVRQPGSRPCAVPAPETPREARIALELSQMKPILVSTDFSDLPDAEQTMVRHVLDATLAVDRLHARQKGLLRLSSQIDKADAESRALFRRNWGPRCTAPRTESDKECTALQGVSDVPVDVYPASLQRDAAFCATLEKHPDAKKLFDPFTVVRERDGKLVAIPYSQATTDHGDGTTSRWSDDAGAAATSLELAAKALEGTKETTLRAYLRAAAKALRDDSWFEADEAWAKMSARNSRFYLRIGPDETYWEPCARKAGFHVSFARVSEASLAWQDRLEPVKQGLEQAMAKAIGAPYVARKVTFHLPEFIEVAWNGGDSRDAIGATIGQSLPNWGPVSKGRGRTVAMANLYTDEDSLASRERAASALLCADVMPFYPKGREPGLVATILHEATHNLGPSQEYRFAGKTDSQAFGGGLASTMEELKAQTGALYFLELLREKNVIDERLQRSSFVDSVVWAFGHVSRGMTTPGGERKPYGQLAAVQLGFLEDEGALVFQPAKVAANGHDPGCFSIDWSKVSSASTRLMSAVGRVKATHDKRAGEALTAKYVDVARHHDQMRERMLREPRPSFVYSANLASPKR